MSTNPNLKKIFHELKNLFTEKRKDYFTMKKITKKLAAIAMAIMTATTMTTNTIVYAEKALNRNIDTNISNSFDEYIEKLSNITYELQTLKYYNSNNENDEQISKLMTEKDWLIQQHDKYNADAIDNEMMRDIIVNSDYSLANKSRYIPQSELEALVKRFETSYVVMGNSATHTEGSTVYKLYQIIVMNKSNNEFSTSRLGREVHKQFYKAINNQTEATQFLNDVINVYVSKAFSSVLEMVPGVALLPYELFFDTKPNPDTFRTAGDGLNTTVISNSIVKFTYVFNESNNSWVFCSSSNQATSEFAAVDFRYPSGSTSVKFVSFPKLRQDGGYANSIPSAVAIFKAMKNNSYISSSNFCVNKVSYSTKYKGELVCEVAAPATPYVLL